MNVKIRSYVITGLWLVTSTCASYVTALWFDHLFKTKTEKLFIFLSEHTIASIIASVLTALLGLAIIYQFGKRMRHQKIRNQPSYVFFLYWGLVLLLLVLTLRCPELSGCCLTLILVAIVLLAVIIYWIWPPLSLNACNRFVAGAVGLSEDELDFKESAINTAKGIIENYRDYLSVYALYGDMGSGKSSYTRMIVEALEDDSILGKQNLLYAYISLTETNAAKDFSHLFSERWANTLTERYPIIRIGHVTPLLTAIFRETNANILSAIFSFLATHNKGLHKTIAKTWDSNLGSKPVYTSSVVGSMFAHIPEISEKIWLIVIDEIERAQFDEIYRLVEAIERFKNEGRNGLPIRIVFILCTSRNDLSDLIEAFKSTDPKAFLLKKFFFEDAKSVTNTLHLPPASYETRLKFTKNKVDEFIKARSANIGFDIKECTPIGLETPSREFIKEPKKAMEYVLYLLMQQPPRIVNRCLSELDFFHAAYRDATGKQVFESICFADLLALSLIRIRYPYLIDFFSATLDKLLPSEDHGLANEFTRRHDLVEKKKNLFDWISMTIPEVSITETMKPLIEELVNFVARSWIDYLKESGATADDKLVFIGEKRTSYPKIMKDYLSLISSEADHFEKNKAILLQHQATTYDFSALSNEDLLEYSRFARDIRDLPTSKHLDIVKELGQRLKSGKVPIQPRNTGSTIYDETLYQFIFQIVEVVERLGRFEQITDKDLTPVFNSWKEVLKSAHMTSGGKLIILNSYFNFEGGRGSDIHHRLLRVSRLFKQHFSDDVKTIISEVFKELDSRYLDGNDIIYEREENFFFTMYQRWSGNPDNADEIGKIRATAKRGLEKVPEVVSLYWTQYPFEDDWQTTRDIEGFDLFGRDGTPLYMPMPDLIEITGKVTLENEDIDKIYRFWKNAWEDDSQRGRCEQLFALKTNNSTLCAILRGQGFLECLGNEGDDKNGGHPKPSSNTP